MSATLAHCAIEQTIGFDAASLISLLEEMGDASNPALAVDISDPLKGHRTTFALTSLLAAGDDPMDGTVQVRREINRLKKRFC